MRCWEVAYDQRFELKPMAARWVENINNYPHMLPSPESLADVTTAEPYS